MADVGFVHAQQIREKALLIDQQLDQFPKNRFDEILVNWIPHVRSNITNLIPKETKPLTKGTGTPYRRLRKRL